MNIQNPGIVLLVVLPAFIVAAAGLLLRIQFDPRIAALIAAALPGVVLTVLALADEGNFNVNGLLHVPVAWAIWTMMSAPGLILGLILLFVPPLRQRRKRLD